MSDVDPVTLEILRNSLSSAAEEMGETLLRTAYSSVIREARDCSTALFGPDGGLIAQAEHIPMHLGSMPYALDYNFERVQALADGELLVFNDPYHGGQHLMDIIAFHPVSVDGERVGYAGSIAHHIDMGGAGAASLGAAVETTYGEGFRFPPLTLDTGTREFDQFLETLATNVRAAEYVLGDVNAQLSANRRGVDRLATIAAKYGVETYLTALDELDAYAERFMRARVADLPDATASAEETVEVDAPPAVAAADTTIRVGVTVSGARLVVDFEGTAEQVPGYVNSPVASTQSAAYFAVLAALGGTDLPISGGVYRPIEVRAPKGSMVNPTEPTATRARMKTCCRVYDAVLRALSDLSPARIPAAAFNSTTPIVFAKAFDDHEEVFMDLPGGGWGASSAGDGAPATTNPLENEMNIPAEAIEQDHPWLRLSSYRLRRDSGGPGRYRGGLGVRRAFVVADGPASGTGYSGRHEHGAWGVEGGQSGATGRSFVDRDGERESLGTTWGVSLESDDRVVVDMGGGGGYGDPTDRPVEAVARDVASGFVSVEAAVETYGVSHAALWTALSALLGDAVDAYAAFYDWPTP